METAEDGLTREIPAKPTRNYWLDLGRLIMALFVVGIHCTRQNGWGSDPNLIMVICNSSLFRTAVPFFFLLTSYFVYDRYLASDRKASVFFKTGLRYFVMYVFWTILYLGVIVRETYVGKNIESATYAQWFFRKFFLDSPLSAFWFLRASAYGLVLLGLPFIWKKMKPIYLLPLALVLYVIGAFGEGYYYFLAPALKNVYASYFKTFYTTRNMVFEGLPFLTLGLVLREYKGKLPASVLNNTMIWVGAAVSLVMVFIENWLLGTHTTVRDYNLTFALLFFDPLFFLGLSRIKKPLKGPVAPYLSDVASLVYFLHIYFRDLYNDVFTGTAWATNYYLRFLLVATFAIIAATAIAITTRSAKIRRWIY